jgi:hypothetical protein
MFLFLLDSLGLLLLFQVLFREPASWAQSFSFCWFCDTETRDVGLCTWHWPAPMVFSFKFRLFVDLASILAQSFSYCWVLLGGDAEVGLDVISANHFYASCCWRSLHLCMTVVHNTPLSHISVFSVLQFQVFSFLVWWLVVWCGIFIVLLLGHLWILFNLHDNIYVK